MGDNKLGILIQAKIDEQSVNSIQDQLNSIQKGLKSVKINVDFGNLEKQIATIFAKLNATQNNIGKNTNTTKAQKQISDYEKSINSLIHSYKMGEQSASSFMEKMTSLMYVMKNNGQKVYTEGFSNLSFKQQEQAYALLAQAEKQFTSTLTTESNNRKKIRESESKAAAKQQEDILKLKTLQSQLNRQINDLKANYAGFNVSTLNGVIADVEKLGEKTKYSAAEAANLKERIKEIQAESSKIKGNGSTGSSSGKGLVNNLTSIGSKFAQYFLVGNVISTTRNAIHQMVESVTELDSALVEMKKVSDLTNEGLNQFTENAYKIGEAVSRTGTDVINAASAFSRMGSSAKEALELANTALIYTNVGDGVSVDGATETIISTMKAFNIQAEDTISIIDKINEVSNNFAISSRGIGEGLKRSASSLKEANNTLDQTIALLAIANTVTQDPVTVAMGLKTISMRLRSVSEETGELIAGQRQLFLDLTNGRVDIMKTNNEFKSTYQIIKDLSEVWHELDDLQKSDLAEAAAGKTRANIFLSLMNSAEDLDKALDKSLNSMGSAMRENEVALESINGKVNMLKSSMESLFTNTVSSDFVKGLVDIATSVVKVVDKFGLLNTTILVTLSYMAFFKTPMWFAQGIGIITAAIAKLTAGLGLATGAAITLNTVLGMLAPVAIAAAIMGLVTAFRKWHVSTEEQRDKVLALKDECDNLKSELEKLKEITSPTQEEKDRIKILELQVAATERLIEENEKLLAQKEIFGKGVWGKGVFGDTGKDIAKANQLITSIKAVQAEMKHLAETDPVGNQDRILSLNERYQELQTKLTPLVSNLTKAHEVLSNSIEHVSEEQQEQIKTMINTLESVLSLADGILGLSEQQKHYNDEVTQQVSLVEQYLGLVETNKEKVKSLSDEYLELNDAIRSVSDGHSVSLSQAKQIVEKYGLQYDAITEVADGYVIELNELIRLRDNKLQALQEMSAAEVDHKNKAIAEIYERCKAVGVEIQSYRQLVAAKAAAAQTVAKFESAKTESDTRKNLFNKATNGISLNPAVAALQEAGAKNQENVLSSALADFDRIMAAQTESSYDMLDKLLSNDTGKKGTQSEKKAKSKSERFASYIEKGLDEDIKAIKAKSAVLEREIETLQAKISVAAAKGDSKEELTLNKQLKEKLAEQKTLLSEQANDLRKLKANIVSQLKSFGYESLKGLDLENVTEKQLADIMRKYEVSIQAANLKDQKQLEANLSMQKDQINEFLSAIIDVNNEINSMSLNWWSVREEELEQQKSVIDRIYQLENELIDKKVDNADLEMILLDENTTEYMTKERQKYDYICERQSLLLKQMKDYLKAGYKENSQHIEDLKKAYYDYEVQRIEMAKQRAEKLKAIAEEELNKQISDLNNAKSSMDSLLNLVISMIKQETNDRKSELQQQLSDKKEALKESYEAQKESLEKEQETVDENLKKEYESRKKALKDKLALLEEEANRRKNALREESEEKSYQEELAEAMKKVSDLEQNLLDVSMDDSVAGIKKRKELEEQLAKAKKDLDKLQYEHSISMQEKAIDEELDRHKEAINKELEMAEEKNTTETENLKKKHEEELKLIQERYDEELEKLEKLYNDQIKELDDFLKSEGKVRDQAMKLLENKSSALYDRLSKYAYEHTSMLEAELLETWETGYEALEKYGEGQESVLGLMENMITKARQLAKELKAVQDSTWQDYAEKDNLEIGKDPNSNISVEREQAGAKRDKIIQQMLSNSAAWFGASKEEQARLAKENEELAKQIGAWKSTTGANSGKWFVKINDKAYEIKDAIGVRHTGIETGFVGGKPLLKSNEEFNKLLKGELVINADQMDTFMTQHLPNMLTQRSNGEQNVVIEKLVDLQIDTVDATTLPQLKSMLKTEIPKVLDGILSRNGIKARGVSLVR